MADLRYGIVTYKGTDVGTLTELPAGGTRFEYYAGAPEIACALPRDKNEHIWPTGVHPVFAHLGPEGWLRTRQKAIADADSDDDLGLLLAFGKDCIGAIGITDTHNHATNFQLVPSADVETRSIAEGQRTISGVQAKILCDKIDGVYTPATADSAASYIAKFAREDLIDLAQNEFITLELTKILLPKDQVNSAELSTVQGTNKIALLVERFDRTGRDKKEKLRCEDFAQVLAVPPGRDRRNKYNQDYRVLAEAVRFSSAPIIDLAKIFQRLVAFVLLGNTDCHLKNWSLLETADGLRLSPIYDVLNTYIYGAQQYSTIFGLQLDGQRIQWDQYDRDLLGKIGEAIGVNPRVRDRIFKDIEKQKAVFFDKLHQPLGLSEEAAFQYRSAIKTKWEQVYGA